jgi:putative peptidoglycan lipid II flippase
VLLSPRQVVVGLAAANSASFVIGAVAGQVWLSHRLGRLSTSQMASTVARITLAASAAAFAGLAAIYLGHLLVPHALPPIRAAVELAAVSVLGGAVLLVGLRALRVSELGAVLTRAAALLRR